MSSLCRYCQKLFTRADNRIRHEKHSCQSSGSEKTRKVSKITFPTEKNHGISYGMEMGEAFRFKTPSSILIVGPSGCGKTCFTESLLLDHLEELFVNPPPTIHTHTNAFSYESADILIRLRLSLSSIHIKTPENNDESDNVRGLFPPRFHLSTIERLETEHFRNDVFTKGCTSKPFSKVSSFIGILRRRSEEDRRITLDR